MRKLELRLLGGFELRTVEGEPVAGPDTRKARALLAYLAMHEGRPQRREALADLLWGLSGPKQAASSLSQALYSIRKALAPLGVDLIGATLEEVRLEPNVVAIDVATFEDLARAEDPSSLREALSLYRGPFLAGLEIAESGYEHWLSAERSRLEGLAVDAGTRLIAMRDKPDRTSAADAERLLALDPYNEAAHRHLMLFHALSGQISRAIRQYEHCREKLKEDLDIEPSQETRDLRVRIKAGEITPEAATMPAGPSARDGTLSSRVFGRTVTVGVAIAFIAAAVWWFAPGPLTTHPGPDDSAPRLAVLPFEIESDDANVRAFAGGIADDITTELSRYPGLAVLSRETAHRFANDDGEAGKLGVTHLLRGRIRRRSDRLTVNAWMTDTGTREQVWAKRYRGSASDLLEFQDTILEDVVAALMEALPASRGAPDASPGTGSLDAYEAYLAGLTYYFELTPEANARAASRFRAALEADPGFAKARAGLAKTYRRAAFADDSFAEALGINWAEAYLELKVLLSDKVEKTADALVLEAGLALRRRGYAEAAGKARQALKLEPSNVEARQVLAETLIYAGDAERGENHARLALQLNPALPARPTFLVGLARYARGDTEGAIASVRDAVAMTGRRDAEFTGLLAAMLGEGGDADGAEDMLAAYAASLENRPRREWQVMTRALDNPRARSWRRPTLASAVYAYPFSDAAILRRTAAGFEAAGLAGATLGHLPAVERNRLDDRAVRELMFDASVEGLGETEVWRQTRGSDGAVIRTSGRGPMLQVPEGSSRVRRGEICDTWRWSGRIIESCAAVYRIPDEAPISVLGDYLLATEFGAFPFRADVSR